MENADLTYLKDIYENVVEARKRIENKLWVTPLMESNWLELYGDDTDSPSTKVYCKLESEQMTGSFKARGALNKMLSLDLSKP